MVARHRLRFKLGLVRGITTNHVLDRRSGEDVAADALGTHGGLVLAQVQVGVAEEVRKVGDATDVLQSFHNHHVLTNRRMYM